MTIAASADLIRKLQRLHLLEAAHCAEAARVAASDPREMAREFVRRGWLTPMQVNKLFQGKGDEENGVASFFLEQGDNEN